MENYKKDLDRSIKDGSAHSVMMGSGETYLSAYGLALGATDKQIGFLVSIPQLMCSISQLFSTKIIETINSRKKMLLIFALIQSLIWIPITYLIFERSFVVWKLILFVTCYWVSGAITAPAWSSWIGDIIPDKIKGKFFGKRNMYNGLSLFISVFISGIILSISSKYNPFIGFGIIFGIAFVSKIISWLYLRRIEEPKFNIDEENKFSFLDFIKRITKTNFGKFAIYISLMTFATQIAAPYFVVYMLRDLKFSYWTYTIVTSVGKISNFAFIAIWGKYSDLFGNKKIMRLTGYMIPLLPILWLFSNNLAWILFIEIFGGFVWSGFNVSTFSFIFDTVSPQKRVRCVSYSNLLNGLSIFLGSTLGGFLLQFGEMFWSNFFLILIVSGIGRLLASIIMLPKIKEVRWVENVSEHRLLFNVVSGVFEGLKYPVLFLSERRSAIKRKSEGIIDWLRKFIEKSLGKRSKYS